MPSSHKILFLLLFTFCCYAKAEPFNFGGKWQKVNNTAGKNYKVEFGHSLDKNSEISFGFGFTDSPKTKNNLAIFIVYGVLELRVSSSKAYLYNKPLGTKFDICKIQKGKPFLFNFYLDKANKTITGVSVNGARLEKFSPIPWLKRSIGNKLVVWATTPSDLDFYVLSPVNDKYQFINEANVPWRKNPAPAVVEDKSLKGVFVSKNKTSHDIDIQLDPKRLKTKQFPVHFYCTAEQWRKVYELIENDPKAKQFWQGQVSYANKALQSGGIGFRVTNPDTYVYKLWGGLRILGIVHMLSGNREVGELLKEILLDTAKRPMTFWMHVSLRKNYNPNFPVGALECGNLVLAFAQAYHWNRELFTEQESKIILDAIRYKGVYPAMRWLDANSGRNNWLAVMASGALAGSKILNEPEWVKYAAQRLKYWTSLVEDDGSYSEPMSYLNYGVESFIRGAMVFGDKRSLDIVKDTSMRGTLKYITYNYIKAAAPVYSKNSYMVNFGDGDFPGSPDITMTLYLTYAFDNGLGVWLINKYNANTPYNLFTIMLKLMYGNKKITEQSPEQLKLPQAIFFDSGLGFIRSNWNNSNKTVFVLRSGDGGKVSYSHHNNNRNAIMLFKNGKYVISESGRTSYRSPLHRSWDRQTISSNTITVNNENQLSKTPAKMLKAAENADFCYLSSDAEKCYKQLSKAHRRVIYIKDLDSFIVRDDLNSKAKLENINWKLFFNNFDHKTIVKELSKDSLLVQRSKATIKVCVQPSAQAKYNLGEGWLHTGYCYSPNDPNEGKKGSSISWTCSSDMDEKLYFNSFIGNQNCKIKFAANEIMITNNSICYKIEFTDTDAKITKLKNGNTVFRTLINDKSGIKKL